MCRFSSLLLWLFNIIIFKLFLLSPQPLSLVSLIWVTSVLLCPGLTVPGHRRFKPDMSQTETSWSALSQTFFAAVCSLLSTKSIMSHFMEKTDYEVGDFSASAQSPGKYVAGGLALLLPSLSAVPPASAGLLALSPSLV